jgi:hypothetical protein
MAAIDPINGLGKLSIDAVLTRMETKSKDRQNSLARADGTGK